MPPRQAELRRLLAQATQRCDELKGRRERMRATVSQLRHAVVDGTRGVDELRAVMDAVGHPVKAGDDESSLEECRVMLRSAEQMCEAAREACAAETMRDVVAMCNKVPSPDPELVSVEATPSFCLVDLCMERGFTV